MIEQILGPDDPRIASYRHVGDPLWLRRHDLFVAEGRLVVSRLLETRLDVVSILATPAACGGLGEPLERIAAPVYVCDRQALSGIAGFNFHRGCLALARRPEPTRSSTFDNASRLLALERVGNPDNVGGLFRAAAAFALDGILLDPHSGDPLYRKAIRTSMGAVLRVPWMRLERWPSDLAWFRARGFRLVALTPHRHATPLGAFTAGQPDERLVVLVGAEGAGLSEAALAAADDRVRIPIADDVDSLNVVVAAGIALSGLWSAH